MRDVRGRQARALRLLPDHGIPHRNCGKLSSRPRRRSREAAIDQGPRRTNGVLDMQTLSGEAARKMEPALNCGRGAAVALHRHHRQPRLHAGAARRCRGRGAACASMRRSSAPGQPGRVELEVGGEADDARMRLLVNAAGLGAPAVARGIDACRSADNPAYLAKGNYFSCSARAPFSHLIYPCRSPRPRRAPDARSRRQAGSVPT